MPDVIELARELVQASDRVGQLKAALSAALANGADPHPATEAEATAPPFAAPGKPRASPRSNGRGGAPEGSTRGQMLQNAIVEQNRIYQLLAGAGRPMKVQEVLALTGAASKSTTSERLRRLLRQGRVSSGPQGWTATPAPAASEAAPA